MCIRDRQKWILYFHFTAYLESPKRFCRPLCAVLHIRQYIPILIAQFYDALIPLLFPGCIFKFGLYMRLPAVIYPFRPHKDTAVNRMYQRLLQQPDMPVYPRAFIPPALPDTSVNLYCKNIRLLPVICNVCNIHTKAIVAAFIMVQLTSVQVYISYACNSVKNQAK